MQCDVSPVSEEGTLLVRILSVMTLNTLRESIMGMTMKQNCTTLVIRIFNTEQWAASIYSPADKTTAHTVFPISADGAKVPRPTVDI